ncbi:MAG: RNA polymerase sigma factor [Bacteroidaceae bacterium]|nr:RNA polymerase sigma factor [Bacteroidaceae bacterium]
MINRKKEPSAELTKTMEEELQDLYRYAFYRLGNEQDAEDIIQDLYISIHEKHDAASNIGNLRNYIYRALSNNCTLLLRKRTNCKTVSIENIEDINLWEAEPKNLEEEFTLINMLLDSIPHEQSEVIRLHIHGNRTFVEIADILEIPVTTAKSRFKYGIDKLKKGFEKSNM